MSFALSAAGAGGVWQYVIFVLYIAIIVTVSILCRKKSTSVNEFLFSKQGLGAWLSAFAYGATYFSAVVFVGYAGKFGWSFGLAAVWIGIGNTLIGTLTAWLVLAKRTRYMTQVLGARTMPEFFEKRYESKHIKLVASIVIFIFLLPYSSSVYQGLGFIFESAIGLSSEWCILILAALTALYLFMGGYFATSVTDFIQGIIMLSGIIALVFVLLANPSMNWGEGLKAISDSGLGFVAHFDVPAGKTFLDSKAFNVIILILLTSFGIWALPQSIHKFYAIKNEEAIKKGVIISSVFSLIIGGGAYFMGSFVTRFITPERFAGDLGGNFDRLVPEMLTQNLPSAMLGLIVVLLFSASMSTLAALSLSSASTVTMDFVKGYVKATLAEKNTNILLRCLCLVFVAISAVLAILKIDVIVTMMSLSWGVLAGCFIGPYVLGLYSKKINKIGAYASIITSLVITFVLVFALGAWQAGDGASASAIIKAGISKSPFIGVVAMAASVIVTPVFSIIFKKYNPSENTLKIAFPKKFNLSDVLINAETVVEAAENVEINEETETEK
ncbi:MAG: sodium:solute symporter family protein [Clostridiales bacterium]|nr:sodium:solute symporter family protein [Clostridiales bacterium]